jgi:flagellar secretion chaperone FliS
MPANPFLASRAYAATGLETTIADASPEQLILMLHDGLLQSIHNGRLAMEEGRIAEKGEAISRALAILTEGLMPALDLERGGDIAGNLASLYEYMITRLMLGNLQNDAGHLDEVAKLVQELKGAWQQLSARPVARAAQHAVAEPVVAGGRTNLSFGVA